MQATVGVTVNTAAADPMPPPASRSLVAVPVASVDVVIVKLTEVAPAGMVTKAGTCTKELSLFRLMEPPPAGAGPLAVIVAMEVRPPGTLLGFSVIPVMPHAGFAMHVLFGPHTWLVLGTLKHPHP